jgi:hypothetical protein
MGMKEPSISSCELQATAYQMLVVEEILPYASRERDRERERSRDSSSRLLYCVDFCLVNNVLFRCIR